MTVIIGIDFDDIDKLRERNSDLKIRAAIELDNDPQSSARDESGSKRIG